jgi:hypothetical protein
MRAGEFSDTAKIALIVLPLMLFHLIQLIQLTLPAVPCQRSVIHLQTG